MLDKVKCHLSDEELEILAAMLGVMECIADSKAIRKFADAIVQQEIKRQCDAISGV